MTCRWRVYFTGLWVEGLAAAGGRKLGADVDGSYVVCCNWWDAMVVAARLWLCGCRVRNVATR